MTRLAATLLPLVAASLACTLTQPAQPPASGGDAPPGNPLAEGLTSAAIPLSTQDAPPQAPATATLLPTPATSVDVYTTIQSYDGFHVETKNTTTHYSVHGETAEELARYMHLLGPEDAGGSRWFALTRPVFDWTTPCGCDEAGCLPAVPTVFVVIEYTFPVWDPPPDAEAELVSRWNAFQQAVETHERGHGERAMQCGALLGDAFVALEPRPTCEDVKAAMLEASGPVFAECRAAQSLYESETNHGFTQGVAWPP